MVRTRSMAISPGHQKSGNAFSHPNLAHQSAPVMQPPSVQQIQSMATAMAELSHQNQEMIWRLTKGGNAMNDVQKSKLRAKKLENEKMLNVRTSQGVSLHVGYHI